MHKILIAIFSLLTWIQGFAQNFTAEEAYELNTARAVASYYTSAKKYTCAINALENLNIKIKNKIEHSRPTLLFHQYGEIYRLSGDSFVSETFYMQWLAANHFVEIEKMMTKKDPFYFLYRRNKEYLDSVWAARNANAPFQDKLKMFKSELNQMVVEDQSARAVDPYSSADPKFQDSVNRSIRSVDSAHAKRLTRLLVADSAGDLQNYEPANLALLFLHLTRYDTATYKVIIKYVNKSMGTFSTMNAMLGENRMYALHDKRPLKEYMSTESDFAEESDFAAIDRERKKYGLPSLFFKMVEAKKKVPYYYESYPATYFPCKDE